jgi:hypothetical protein
LAFIVQALTDSCAWWEAKSVALLIVKPAAALRKKTGTSISRLYP